jgi:hypothetical protein
LPAMNLRTRFAGTFTGSPVCENSARVDTPRCEALHAGFEV